MNTRSRIATLMICATLAGFAALLAHAGPLDPPAGPVAPTMKDLDTVEPRVPLSADTTPGDADSVFRITQPGSYYLTGDIVGGAGFHGIEIAADDVTLDLRGFGLQGQAGSLDAIRSEGGTRRSLVVINGTISNWDGNALNLGDAWTFRIQGLTIRGIAGTGIIAGYSGIITDCALSELGNGGIATQCCTLIARCRVGVVNGAPGISAVQDAHIVDCTLNNCDDGGIRIEFDGLVERCNVAFGVGFAIQVGDHCLVRSNHVQVAGTGILALGNGNRIEANHASICDTGFGATGVGNLIINNSATQCTTGYSLAAGNMAGPIVTAASMATNTNPGANYQH